MAALLCCMIVLVVVRVLHKQGWWKVQFFDQAIVQATPSHTEHVYAHAYVRAPSGHV